MIQFPIIAPRETGRPKPPRSLFGKLKIDRRGLALLAALDLVAQLLALLQIADPRPLDGRDVYEHVFRAVIRLNKVLPFCELNHLTVPADIKVPP